MTSVVVLFAYSVKLNISNRKGVKEILPKKLYIHFNWSVKCNQENVGKKFRFRNTLSIFGTLKFTKLFTFRGQPYR